MDEARRRIEATGIGFSAVALKHDDTPIGFCGLVVADLEPFLPRGTVEIGWRLALPFWGKGYVTEAGKALLRHGFIKHRLDEIVSFAVTDNNRSTAVMKRLGLQHDPARDFDHPRVPDSHPHLKRHVLYSLSRSHWEQGVEVEKAGFVQPASDPIHECP